MTSMLVSCLSLAMKITTKERLIFWSLFIHVLYYGGFATIGKKNIIFYLTSHCYGKNMKAICRGRCLFQFSWSGQNTS